MAISREEAAKLAVLARLRLTSEELETFTSQLSSILDYVAQLQKLDTENVEPMAHGVTLQNVFREDRAIPSLEREEALANAPQHNGESFLVPVVLEQD